MPSPGEILSDPKFQGLPVGEQLKVMRTVDPSFASLPAKEQGAVIAKSRLKTLGYDKIGDPPAQPKTGFLGRLGGDIKGTAKTLMGMSPNANPAMRAESFRSLVQPNIDEGKKALNPSLSKTERFGHGLAAVIPGVGPMAARAGEDIGNRDYGAASADILELAGPKIGGEFIKGFREGWESAGPKAKSAARGANAPWRRLPGPSTPAPQSADSIPSKLPSGRTPGGIADPRTVPEPQAASTADKLPRWHMIRDQAKGKTPDASGIPGELPSGRKVPAPDSRATVDAAKVDESAKSAAELMKAVGIGPDEILQATPEQWKMIEQQVGSTFDRQAAIKELQAMSGEAAKPSPKGTLPTPKTPKPTPGGAKVESTVTPEARAARAEEHATKLAATIRKTLAADKIPEPGNDAAWKVLEDQTGTEATPAVRKAAIDKARKLWSEGPRSAGDLQRRRAEYFQNNPKQ